MIEPRAFDFDVALSFAGEDRAYVEQVAAALTAAGVPYFFYTDHLAEMWGENLVEYLQGVFRQRSRFALIFVSRHYVEKVWTRVEHQAAMARALEQRSAYVLPVRLDDTDLPGLLPTTSYLDARLFSVDELVKVMNDKLANKPESVGTSVTRTPRDSHELEAVLMERPPGWEYLYFAGCLHAALEASASKFLDHEVHYARPSGAHVEEADVVRFLQRAMDENLDLVNNLTSLMAPEAQTRAFGAPGEAGDPVRIHHLASRWNDVYEGLMDWAARLRGVSRPAEYGHAFEILASFVDAPVLQYRSFVEKLVEQFDRIPELLRAGKPVSISLTLTLSIDENVLQSFANETSRLRALVEG